MALGRHRLYFLKKILHLTHIPYVSFKNFLFEGVLTYVEDPEGGRYSHLCFPRATPMGLMQDFICSDVVILLTKPYNQA